MVNAQTERKFGYSRNDLLGKPAEMLLPERYRPNHLRLRTEFFATPLSRPMGAGRDLYALRIVETERLRCLEVDDKLVLRRCLRGKYG